MIVDEFKGSHYDIGLQIGHKYCVWIERTVAFFIDYHKHEFTDSQMKECVDYWESSLQEKVPDLFQQLLGISKASSLSMDDILAMNFRFWNILDKQRRINYPGSFDVKGEGGCTNVVLKDPSLGILLGGSLDDIQLCWHIGRFYPKNGYKHIAVTWVGSAWASRGLNEHGLAVGSSDLTISGIEYTRYKRFSDFALKEVLEKARTVDEAVQIFRSLGPHKGISVMFADSKGQTMLIESCIAGEAVHEIEGSSLFCVNHVKSSHLQSKMESMGYIHKPSSWSQYRYNYLTEKLGDENFSKSWDNLQGLLSDHGNFPESLCHRMAAFVTLAAPQKWPKSLWISNGPCCRHDFERFDV